MQTSRLDGLVDYPFDQLRRLLDGLAPPDGVAPLNLALGEPQHAPPPILEEALRAHGHLWSRYPPVEGSAGLRHAAAAWLTRRFALPDGLVDPDAHVLAVSGTREALFMLGQLAVPERKDGARPAVLLPNPFYAPYEGAAVMAGAEPVFLDLRPEAGFLPDLDALEEDPALLRRTALIYLCNPSNPQGVVASRDYLARAIALARVADAVLAVDECYAEIYDAEPPPGALEAAGGRLDNLLVFQSLSKRSSAAGLRAGFVAGDPELIARFRHLRRYGSAGMPLPVDAAATALWGDDAHVADNRARYRAKIDAAERALAGTFGACRPPGGFFLWLDVGDGEAAAARLWEGAGIRVLPGAYLARAHSNNPNPGAAYIRVALVHEPEVIADAMTRLRAVLADRPAAAALEG
jgi:aspartate/methionine/tyrosine aminotransferase